MSQKSKSNRGRGPVKVRVQRRGAVAVLVAVAGVMVMGFAVLTVDVGVMYATKADLQRAADAAALAGTQVLNSTHWKQDPIGSARKAAMEVVAANPVLKRTVSIVPEADIAFGRVSHDEEKNVYVFTESMDRPNGMRVNVRHTDDSPNGAVPLYFAGVFGKRMTNISASATAAMIGSRDISIVIDLSGSMKHDSYLRFYDQYQLNARDIWCALDGPPPSKPYIPGAEHETEYANDTGPTVGIMNNWGNPINPTTWDPTTDPGLWYIPRNSPCTVPEIATSLSSRGYSAAQTQSIMAGSSTSWENRTAVMLGLATWTPSSGSDTSVSDNELTWIPYPPYRKNWSWKEYIGWAGESNSKLTSVHPEFQYRFGLKTYTDFLLDRKDNFSQTDLTQTPEEPLRAVKDGVQSLVEVAGIGDHLALEVFGSTSKHEKDLSKDRQSIADRLYDMQANHYDNSTNIGGGLEQAVTELTSSRAREGVSKVVILMSDGANMMGPDPILVAQRAAAEKIKIYTVSVGYGADRDLMRRIAEMTGGQEFYAIGTPEEYTEQLQEIYMSLGKMGAVSLIE